MQYLVHVYTEKKLLIVYLKFKFISASYIVPRGESLACLACHSAWKARVVFLASPSDPLTTLCQPYPSPTPGKSQQPTVATVSTAAGRSSSPFCLMSQQGKLVSVRQPEDG